MIAGVVLFVTRNIDRSIAMLIVACPCTILLSGPTAIIAALSAAARLGVVFKDVSTLETASKVDTLLFDKTGTLTKGKLKVISVNALNGFPATELLRIVGSLEQYSQHPAAKAITKECIEQNIKLYASKDFSEKAGMGVKGVVKEQHISVGRREWIEDTCNISIDEYQSDQIVTVLHVAIDRNLTGSIVLRDTIKPDAAAVIQNMSYCTVNRIVMITGDRKEVAHNIASQIGCEFEAEVLPHQKKIRVEQEKADGRIVAVVGDGVNDAPALATGDVSIAMGAAGSDVAIHSASVILMNDQLNRIPFVFKLSRRVSSITKQNLIFSILFIASFLIISAAGMIPPVVAALLHTVSTIVVVFNSARLLREGETII
jgi:Cd2+/Zn2+-exporting ATPase